MRILILLLLIFTACKTEYKSPEIKSQYEKVMVIHDEVMPEMSTINRLKRNIKKTGQKDSITLSLLTQLSSSEDAMMDWMAGFDLNHELAVTEQLAYLEKEETEISKVSEMMKTAIAAGKDYLEKKTNDK